jgi:hypothetical protein
LGDLRKKGKRMQNILRNLIVTTLFSTACVCAQVQVIPQVADGKDASGGSWASTLVLTNTTASPTTATLAFYSGGQSWTPSFAGVQSTENMSLPAASTLFLQTPGTAPTLTQGWAQLTASSSVVAYVIYTYTTPSQLTSQGTAQAVTSASRILVPFDNTGSLGTELAVVNPSSSEVTISANLKTTDGTVTTTSLSLPGQGQTAFVMSTQTGFTGTAHQSGLAEFYSTGSFAIIALQSNTNPTTNVFSFTTAPVYSETGPPIISTGGSTASNIVDAVFLIGIVNVTEGATTMVEDLVQGAVNSYTSGEWQVRLSGTQSGHCYVYQYSAPTGQIASNAASSELDAGTLSLSGPNVPSGTVVPSLIGPVYLKAFPSGTFTPGGTYTLTGNGGKQVEPFTVSATLPTAFNLTNWNSITGINRSQPLTLNWTGGQGTELLVSITSVVSGQGTYVGCVASGSASSITIPTDVLAKLGAVPAGSTSALLVQAAQGVTGGEQGLLNEVTSFLPGLVAGGQANYGLFAPYIGYVNTGLAIQ